MDHVYIVSEGEYSDYGVYAAFDDQGKAARYAREIGGRVEVLPFNQPAPQEVDCVSVLMTRTGEVVNTWKKRYPPYEAGFDEFAQNYRISYRDGIKPENLRMCWTVVTDSEECAIKVVNEKRAQIIAADLWGDTLGVIELFAGKEAL